jgi:hypothetical protein
MRRAKKAASVDNELSAEERRELAGVLIDTHERLRLWRKCKKKPCRRSNACRGDVDQCGARVFPQPWAWVHHVLKAIRGGRPPQAAVRDADQRMLGYTKRFIVDFGFGEPARLLAKDDGTTILEEIAPKHLPFAADIKPLTGASSAWLRGMPRGKT